MGAPQTWRINSPDVISETIDGETIILHLGNGYYFSVTGCGPTAWSLLSGSVPVQATREVLAARFEADGVDVDAELERFIGELQAEQLIVPADDAAAVPPPAVDGTAAKAPFEAPTVQKFTDMEDLLLLDPVHEVSPEKGWPHGAPSAASGTAS